MAEVREVDLMMIQFDPEIQPRERLFQKPLRALTQLLQEDGAESVPPVVLFHDTDDVYWLADGHYRVTAAKKALNDGGPRILLAKVHPGTKRDAFFYAAGANKHGTQLTDAEKRRVVKRLLQDEEWQKMNDSEIARHVGVSNSLVSGIHRELDSQEASLHHAKIAPETRTVRRGGKEYQMKKGNIGRSRSKKAKTTPTTTPPDSPAITQDAADTIEDEERNTNDTLEVVEAVTIQDIDDHVVAQNEHPSVEDADRHTNDDQEQDQKTDTSTAISTLKDAWRQANSAERFSFLQWLIHHEKDEMQNRALDALSALVEPTNEDIR